MLERKCTTTRSTRRYLRALLMFVAACSAVAGLGYVFSDTPLIENLRKRFMMGSPTKVKQPTKQFAYRHAAVASDNAECSKVGRNILKKGGSAIDAAIATTLCVGVINMHSTGIGGGGFMLVYDSHKRSAEMIDFRETAPEKSGVDVLKGDPMNGIRGGLAVAVPGELKGLEAAWKKYGKLPWKELFKPAISIAKKGFALPETVEIAINIWKDLLLKDKTFRRVFTRNGKLLKKGDRLRRPQLAKTLQLIAEAGSAEPFYNGPMSKVLVKEVQAAGGILTLNDLKNYNAVFRPALRSKLDDMTILNCPPPTSGPVLAMTLNILDGFKMGEKDLEENPVRTYHRIIETFKFAYKYRSMLGDPVYEKDVNKTVKEMMSTELADELRHLITDNETHAPGYYGSPRYHVPIKTGTTHLSVLAANGDAVSLTSSVNGYFGAKFLSNKLGFVYNNDMDDFSSPNVTNEFGLPPSPVNYIKPGKRPQSSTVPAIVVDKKGNVLMAIGAAGGTIITTSVAQAIMNYFWFKRDLQTAITMPRVHDQLYPSSVFAETKFPTEVVKGLEALGHKVEVSDVSHGVVQGIVKNPHKFKMVDSHGRRKGYVYSLIPQIYAESDYRKGGQPAGY
ncbi:glutathione hydrolase 1 proenzyme-like [Montipora capricornis]|uniref:glutathione hydrolase 1 proenzyme-like n=1 Tax=Montipora foliosa TaxID=591990 RepID=UPI0035F1896F